MLMLQSLTISAFSETYDFQHFVAINRNSMNFLKKSRKKQEEVKRVLSR